MNKYFLRCVFAVAAVAPCAFASAQAPAAAAVLQAAVECKAPLVQNAAVKAAMGAGNMGTYDIEGQFTIYGLKASKIQIFIGTDGDGESYTATFDTASLKDVAKAAKLNKAGRRELIGKHLEASTAVDKVQLGCVVYN
jgi:hypothetical protein